MMQFIDTHCHLFLKEFDTDREDVVKQCIAKGISKMILPNVDSATIAPLLETCKINPAALLPAMGLHPCSVKENYKEEIRNIRQALESNKYVAIGEIGIDLYWDKTHVKEQIAVLEEQLDWAQEFKLPVIIHCRESFEQVYTVVHRYSGLRGIFHAFSGNIDQAERAVDMGFYLGIGGVVTFKNGGLDKVVGHVPLEKIVLETDSPYLTPTPHRGKRNTPLYIPLIADKLAEIFNITTEEVAEVTTENGIKLFGI